MGDVRVSRGRWRAAAFILFAAGCAAPADPAGVPQPLRGTVAFPSPVFAVQATVEDIAVAATVSLISPSTGVTLATALTTETGAFQVTVGSLPAQTYYLEAVKGLSSNAVSHDAARLRTLVRWTGSGWQALTTGDASIGTATTALSAIVALRALAPDALMGKLSLGPPVSFSAAGTGISQDEFTRVQGLVSQALQEDRDALANLLFDGAGFSLKAGPESGLPPVIGFIRPNPAAPGAQITISGTNFATALANNTVTLDGTPLTLQSGTTQNLVASLGPDARSGVLRIATSGGLAAASLSVIPLLAGGFRPQATASLTPGSPGKNIEGSLFGRFAPREETRLAR